MRFKSYLCKHLLNISSAHSQTSESLRNSHSFSTLRFNVFDFETKLSLTFLLLTNGQKSFWVCKMTEKPFFSHHCTSRAVEGILRIFSGDVFHLITFQTASHWWDLLFFMTQCFNEALMHIFYLRKIDWNPKKLGEKFLRLKEVEKLMYRQM